MMITSFGARSVEMRTHDASLYLPIMTAYRFPPCFVYEIKLVSQRSLHYLFSFQRDILCFYDALSAADGMLS